jgi:hypothetical protein
LLAVSRGDADTGSAVHVIEIASAAFGVCRAVRDVMRQLLLAALLISTTAYAESPPRYVPGEVIIIRDRDVPRPSMLPHPKKDYRRMAPPYSEKAIMSDVWVKAWVVLDIDTRGNVARVKLLNNPGHDLDQIAIDHALKMRFEPALDAKGHPLPTQLVWALEWPSYWYMVTMEHPPNRVLDPERVQYIPCYGSGPLNLEMLHPVYRDCTQPDLSKISTEPWYTK